MSFESTPHMTSLKQLFYLEMENLTSACLFGSAATSNWIPGRSDLDLFVLVPAQRLDQFGEKLSAWKSNSENPLLDGFVIFSSAGVPMVKRIDEYEKPARTVEKSIGLIDLWNIKYRSRHLFGDELNKYVREISIHELQIWAQKDIRDFWIPTFQDLVSRTTFSDDAKVPLSKLIWTASAVARIAMLTEGRVCDSKLEALQWLLQNEKEIRDPMQRLIADFEKPDLTGVSFDTGQTFALGRTYLRLLREKST